MSESTACPVLAAFDVAEELLNKYAHLHADPASARGALMLSRELTERLHKAIPCTPSVDSRGQLVCSLTSISNDLHAYLFQPNMQGGWAVELAAVAKGEADDRNVGSYL